MVKPDLGTKRVCVACGAKFYDLQKAPAVCPKCGTVQPADQPRLRRPAGNVPQEDKRPKKVAEDVDADIEVVADDDDEDVLEDTSDLEEDDPIGTEIEVGTDNDADER